MNRRQWLAGAALLPWCWPRVLRAASGAAPLVQAFGPPLAQQPVRRVFAAGPPAAVLVYCLAPQALLGWPFSLSEAARRVVAAPQRDLPMTGRLAGRGSTVTLEGLMALRPDVIIDVGTINDTYRSAAERVSRQTGIPYLLVDGGLLQSPAQLQQLGALLGVAPRGQELATAAQDILDLAAQLRLQRTQAAPTVYLARGADGLETALPGTVHMQAIEMAGGVPAMPATAGGNLVRVSMEQLLAWDPDYIVSQYPQFIDGAAQSGLWRQLRAVREGRLVAVPTEPFGWLDGPPGINRLLGLRWMLGVFDRSLPAHETRAALSRDFQLFYGVAAPDTLLSDAMGAVV